MTDLQRSIRYVYIIYAKCTERSSTYVGLAQTRSNYQSVWLCQLLRYLIAVYIPAVPYTPESYAILSPKVLSDCVHLCLFS